MKYSYFVGIISGMEDVGGLVGKYNLWNPDMTEGSYFGIASGSWDWDGDPTDDEAMKDPDTFEGWDFIGTWRILAGQDYPDLIDNSR